MPRKNLLFLILLLIATTVNYAQKIKWSGYGAVGYKYYNRLVLNHYNQETYYEGKIQADIEFSKKIEGQLDLRGNSVDNSMKLREATIKLEISDYLNLKVGNIKKPFGYEYLVNEEELISIERSYVQERNAELGYGGRAVSIMAYHKYSDKHPEFPFSYYLSIFRDNTLFTGIVSRFEYHLDQFGIGLNYMFENKGGDYKISTHGFGGGIFTESNDLNTSMELFLVQDPFESNRRKLQGNDEKVFSFGGKISASYFFEMNEEFLKGIEPVIMLSSFTPDTDATDDHVIQLVTGANFYLHKQVRARINGDLRLTKNQYNSDYSTQDSRLNLQIQMTFE